MANTFSTNQLILGNSTVTTTGNSIFINGVASSSALATSGNVESTGTALQNQITSIKDGTGVFIRASNLNGLISTGSADLRYLQTGVSGEFLKGGNLNGLANSGTFVSGISITGGVGIRGALNISAGTNITLTQAGSNTFTIAASTGIAQLYCGSGNPEGIVTAMSGSIYTDWFNLVQYNKYTGVATFGWS